MADVPKEEVEYLLNLIEEKKKERAFKKSVFNMLSREAQSTILATNRPFIIDPRQIASQNEADPDLESTIHNSVVLSAESYWHGGIVVEPGRYRLKPSVESRWSTNVNHPNDYCSYGPGGDGFQTMSRHQNSILAGYPGHPGGNTIVGGEIAVAVFQHQADGTAQANVGYIQAADGDNLYFYLIQRNHRMEHIDIGEHGGSIHFMIVDQTGTYGDNSGSCDVQIIRDF